MVTSLTINLVNYYKTAEEARFIGQAIDRLLKSGGYGYTPAAPNSYETSIRLASTGENNKLSQKEFLIQEEPDRTNWVVGGQEAAATIQSFVRYFEGVPDLTPVNTEEFWAPLFIAAQTTGQVNIPLMKSLLQERLNTTDNAYVIELLVSASAEINAAQMRRNAQTVTPKKR